MARTTSIVRWSGVRRSGHDWAERWRVMRRGLPIYLLLAAGCMLQAGGLRSGAGDADECTDSGAEACSDVPE